MLGKLRTRITIEFETEAWLFLLVAAVLIAGSVVYIVSWVEAL